jgi:UDP-glucuronate decarboxylase
MKSNEKKRKVLITGGHGFVGSHIAERFIREGWDVFIVDDNSSETMNKLNLEHKFFAYSVTDPKCEEIFRIYNIEVIVHMAEKSASPMAADYLNNSETNFLGLAHMLMLAQKYKVQKFFLASSASVVDQSAIGANEQMQPMPHTAHALQKSANEQYALHWKELYGTDITILRFSTVYGPGQLYKHGVIATLMHDVLSGREIEFVGDFEQSRDFIYIDDAAFAVYRAAERMYQGDILNISSNQAITFQKLWETLNGFLTMPTLKIKSKQTGTFQRAVLNNQLCKKELGWDMKIPLGEGLRKTYEWYKQSGKAIEAERIRVEKAEYHRGLMGKFRPYLENIGMFILMILVMMHQKGSVVNTVIGIDFNYVYIAAMGLLYGKKQSMPAAALSAVLLIYTFLYNGADIVALLYLPQHLLHFASYLFVAVFTGYITDNKNRTIDNLEYRNTRAKERYEFLEDMYTENIKIKNKLYNQIVNSDDSIGRTYQIIKKLDSVELEDVFTQAAEVIVELMNAEQVAIYVVGKNRYYLRQKVRRGDHMENMPRSLKVEQFPYLQELMEKQNTFINRTLDPSLPDLAAPVVFQNQVIAVIQIFNLDFDKWNLYQRNLLAMTARLIASAIGKAYQYEEGIQSKKYIADTRILCQEEFSKIYKEVQRRKQVQNPPMQTALLKITTEKEDYVALDHKLSTVIRAEDFIGECKGQLYILLLDIMDPIVKRVQERMQEIGVHTEIVMEENYE